MNVNREFITTSISIPHSLLDRAKTQAELTFRTFSQYVCYLIDKDLKSESASHPPVGPVEEANIHSDSIGTA